MNYRKFSGLRQAAIEFNQGLNSKNIVLAADPSRQMLYIEGGTGNTGQIYLGIGNPLVFPSSENQPLGYFLLHSGNPGNGRSFSYVQYGPIIQGEVTISTTSGIGSVKISAWSVDCPFSEMLCPDNPTAKLGFRFWGTFRTGLQPPALLMSSNPARVAVVTDSIGAVNWLHFGGTQNAGRLVVDELNRIRSLTISEIGQIVTRPVFVNATVAANSIVRGGEIYRL